MNSTFSLPVLVELDEDKVFIVSCPSLKGCRSYGDSIDEAMENLQEAIELCLMDNDVPIMQNKYVGFREITVHYEKNGNLSYA